MAVELPTPAGMYPPRSESAALDHTLAFSLGLVIAYGICVSLLAVKEFAGDFGLAGPGSWLRILAFF